MEENSPALCVTCGQAHLPEENHLYSYTEEVDDDLICHICLQPLLQPLDTLCGHTFCTACLTNFLLEKDFCPMDRKLVALQNCRKSSILVNNLLDKLMVSCPFTEHCSEVVQRGHLEQHFQTRCKGASHYGLTKERKRRSQDCSPDRSSSLAVAALGPELSAAAAIALMTDEPGLVNPAFSPTSEDSQSGSGPRDLHCSNRNRTRHFERSTIRSRSFKKINKAFSVLRRTKSGSAVSNQVDQEREAVGNSAAGEEDTECSIPIPATKTQHSVERPARVTKNKTENLLLSRFSSASIFKDWKYKMVKKGMQYSRVFLLWKTWSKGTENFD